MIRQWTRRGIIGALLLALAAFLVVFIRADEQALYRHLIAQLEQVTGRAVHGEQARLSLQHGVSLKISRIGIKGRGESQAAGDWSLQADVVRFDISLISLLLGDLQITSVDLVHPVLQLGRPIAPSDILAGPFADKLMLGTSMLSFRQGRVLVGGQVLADEISATVRSIDREQQITWELQSRYAGGDFSSQGYIRSQNTGGDKVFGRISAGKLQLAQITGLPLPSLHYDRLDASLTFSVDDTGQWEWFGNLLTHDAHDELPELSWRGKLAGSAPDDFRLHDAFVRFGENTRLVLEGGCEKGQPCRLGLNTRGANPGLILKALSLDTSLDGKLDGKLEMAQETAGKATKQTGWKMQGRLGLRGASWGDAKLPDSVISFSDMHVGSLQAYRIGHIEIVPEGEVGRIELTGLDMDDDALHLALRMEQLHDAWVPLGNILLSSGGWRDGSDGPLKLAGEGVLDGSMQWDDSAGGMKLTFDIAAGAADIRVGNDFIKPAGVAAGLHGSYARIAGGSRLDIGTLQLADSRVDHLHVSMHGDSAKLSLEGARIDVDDLPAKGVKLPGVLAGWQGSLSGSLGNVMLPVDGGMRRSLAGANGSLQLKGFGREGKRLSGKLSLRSGRIQGRKLNWQQVSVFVDFDADISLPALRGKVDIARAGFSWLPEAPLPDWLAGDMADAEIKGHFRQTDMLWNDNTWKDLQGGYSLRQGKLQLDHVRGQLGDGLVQSRSMQLEGVPGGVHFSGLLGMSAVRLNGLQDLMDVTGAKLDGYAFVNARLEGMLPLGRGAWRGNGDIEVHRGLWKEAKAAHHIEWLNDAALKLAEGGGERFDRLSVRFRLVDDALQLRRLRFTRGELTASGQARISAAGEIEGRLSLSKGGAMQETDLSGRWPSLSALLESPAP